MEELTRNKYSLLRVNRFAIVVILNIFLIPASYNVAFAAPTTPTTQADQCPSFCRSSLASVLNYEDKEYLYDYESEITTTVDSSKPESKKTNVKAEVVLSAKSSCNFVIRVRKLALGNDGGEPQLVKGLERSGAKFTLEDGVVGSLCIGKSEPAWTANIKRAVISLLQNKALSQNGLSDDEGIESDISGKCPTKYEVKNGVYIKSKNLNECTSRDSGLSILHGVPYEIKSKQNSAADLDSTQTCEQVLENGIYKSITCSEIHTLKTQDVKFLPSLQTSIKTSLKHQATRPGQTKQAPPSDLLPSSIFFDNIDTAPTGICHDAAKTTVSEILDRICSNIRPDGVTSQVPQEILNLKNYLANIRGSDLTDIYNQIGNSLCSAQGPKLKKLLVHTAAISASDGAIHLLAELYSKNELDLVAKRYFYLYTSFATKPSESALRDVFPLLSAEAPKKRLVLTVSGLAHRYCKVSNPDCINNADYQNLVNRLAALAQQNCLLHTENQLNLGITSLEALGNVDSLTPKAVSAIQKCLAEGTNRVKSVSLKAFRRDPCNPPLKADAISVFDNLEIPSNVRINAFTALLRCLNPSEVPVVQRIINEEKSVQVGGYVRSLLKNIVRSSNPSTRHLQSAARKLTSGVKYPKEIRKFSTNFASSVFYPVINAGISASGDILFDKESFLPRELAANLTIDAFGSSYNLIDVGVHLENFDSLQESLFGPEGTLSSDNNLNHIMNTVFKQPGTSPRTWRTASVASAPADPPTADVYVRIFGTTVALVSLNADSVSQRTQEAADKIKNFVRQALQTSTRDVDFIAPILFVDDHVSVPTIAGFALINSLEGTIIPSLEYKRFLNAPPDTVDFNMKLVTNAATTLKATHNLVAGCFESGIQLEGNVRTGGSIELILHTTENKMEARLNLPNEKVRALELSTNVNWLRRSGGTPRILTPYRQSLQAISGPEYCEDIFLNQLIKFTGLEICTSSNINAGNGAEASIPFLLRGKQYFIFNLQKTEPSMEGYAVVANWAADGGKREFELTLDTPGSATNRKVTLLGQRRHEAEQTFTLFQLTTPNPEVNVKLEYDYTSSESVQAVNAKLTFPSSSYSINGKINLASTAPGETTYKPLLQFEYPGKKSGTTLKRTFLTGKIVHTPGTSLSFDLSHEFPEKLVNINPMKIFLKGSVARSYSGQDYSYEFKDIELGARNADFSEDVPPSPLLKIKGLCKSEEDATKLLTDLDILVGFDLEHHFTFHKQATRLPGKYSGHLKTTSSGPDVLNIEIHADHSKHDGKYDSKYKFVVGPDAKPKWSLSTQTHVQADSVTRFDVQNELNLRFSIDETYDVTLKTHVKNAAGEEQLVDIQLLNGENGKDSKAVLSFNRKAADNNDFKLHALYICSKHDVEFTHTRTTVTDASKDWSFSVKHETTFSSQSLKITKDHLITHIRYTNTEAKSALSVNSKLALHNGFDLGLDIGAEKSAKKYAGKILLKLSGEEAGLIDVLALRDPAPTDTQVSIKSFLAKTYRVELTRKTPSNTEANTHFRADILATGRVITLDVQRKKVGDAYEVDGDLKWDAETDPSQSIQLHSVTKVTTGSIIIESKNDVTVVGQKVQLNVNAKLPTNPFLGEHSFGIEYVSTAGKTYKVDYKNDLEISSTKRTANADISVSLPDTSPVQLRLKAQSLNPRLSDFVFDVSSEVQIFTKGEKTHDLVTELRSAKDDSKLTRSLHGKLATGGSALSEPILLDSELTVGQTTFSTKNSFQVGSNVVGVEIEALSQDGVPSLTYTFTNIPGLKYKKIEGTKTYNIQWSKNDRIYKFGSTHAIKADSQPLVTYSYDFSLESDQLEGKAGVVYIGKPVFNANIKGRAKREDVALEGYLTFGEQAKPLTWDLKWKSDDAGKTFVLGSSLEENAFKLKLDLPEQSVCNLALNTKRGSSEYQVDLEVILKEKQKSVSVVSTRNRSEVLIEIKLNASEQGDAYKFAGLVTRATTTVSAEGQLQKVSGGYEGSVNYQLPGNSAGVAKFTVAIEANRRKISLVAGDQAQPLEFVDLEYTKDSTDPTSTKYQGTFSTDLVKYFDDGDKVSGSFKAEYKRFSSKNGDKENGRSFTSHSTFASSAFPPSAFPSGTIDLEIKHTDKELRAFTSVTSGSDYGVAAEIQAKAEYSNTVCDGAVKLLLERTSDGSKSSYGLASSTHATKTPYNLDHSTEFFFDRSSIKIKAYGNGKPNDQCEGGLDVTLPARTISLTYSTNSATSGEFTVWLDKVRQPDQKLHADLTFEKLSTDDGASGYKYSIAIQHPKLAKPLLIKRRVVRFGTSILLDSETELDVFTDSTKKILIISKIEWADQDHLNGKLSVKSEGLGLSLDGKANLEIKDDSFDFTLGYNYKNRNGETVSRRGAVTLSGRHQSLTIGEPSSPAFYIARSLREGAVRSKRRADLSLLYKSRDVVDVRYEFHLPGMVDNRVFDIYAQGSLPPQLHIKTYATSAEPRRAYELSLGFPTEQLLLIGLYKQVGSTRSTLTEFSTALNGTNFLSIKTSWNVQNIQESLKQAQERLSKTAGNAESTSEALVSELSQDVQNVLEKLTQASQDLKPLRDHIKGELQEMKKELVEDENSKLVAQTIKSFCDSVELAFAPLEAFINEIPDIIERLKESSPVLVKRYEKLVLSLKRTTANLIRVLYKTARPIIAEIRAAMDQASDKIQADFNAGAKEALNKAQTLSDSVLAQVAEAILRRLDDVNSYLESSPVSPQVKELIKTLLKYTVVKLKGDEQEATATQEEIIQQAKETIRKLVREIFTVDLKNGYVAVLIPLPRPVNSLYDFQRAIVSALTVPRIEIPNRNQLIASIQVLRQFLRELVKSDLLTAIIAALRTNAPPHSANAFIIGSQYFITFDGKEYHYEGNCKYQLIQNQDLNVFLTFSNNKDGRVQKSISVEYNGRVAVTINPDFSFSSGDPNVRVSEDRLTDIMIVDVGFKGRGWKELTITCNKASDVCVVRLENGYRYGKVSGLLGTYNNEQYDDFETPSGKIASNVQEFASSWRVDPSCSENSAPQHSPVASLAKSECSSTFKGPWSPLRACFKYSNPSEFETICENLSTEQGWTLKEAVCTAAFAYEQTCPVGLVDASSYCK